MWIGKLEFTTNFSKFSVYTLNSLGVSALNLKTQACFLLWYPLLPSEWWSLWDKRYVWKHGCGRGQADTRSSLSECPAGRRYKVWILMANWWSILGGECYRNGSRYNNNELRSGQAERGTPETSLREEISCWEWMTAVLPAWGWNLGLCF